MGTYPPLIDPQMSRHFALNSISAIPFSLDYFTCLLYLLRKASPSERDGNPDFHHSIIHLHYCQSLSSNYASTTSDLLVIRELTLVRSEEHTSDSSHVASSYAVFCLKKNTHSVFRLLRIH